ncbi:uncharacterized protein LOC128642294 isoform X2 [Bombina bombina]|uniref:uncharacterized protein LOC128642294 isoform X2 n=1 Tax=Bombina bombina TaxID=8345 RepID=UPI00235A5B8A|nr:uncharacterized protein LOC128642294 isoform X2 [Bombina bombina]
MEQSDRELEVDKSKDGWVLVNAGSSESTCRKVVGIFSRSSRTDYNWLTTHLKSEAFQNLVEDVKPFFISNSNGKEFRNTVAECNFGILYHTKKRGRVNVTDVTDSLYDYELNYMSDILGKRNVIVVIDDLQESSAAEKNRILKSQTSIGELAADIILFTDKERDPNYREPLPTPEDKEGLQKKLLILKELLEKESGEEAAQETQPHASPRDESGGEEFPLWREEAPRDEERTGDDEEAPEAQEDPAEPEAPQGPAHRRARAPRRARVQQQAQQEEIAKVAGSTGLHRPDAYLPDTKYRRTQ